MNRGIAGTSKIESVVGKVSFAAFSRVCSLKFFEDQEGSKRAYSIELVMQTDRSTQNFRLRIRFTGVKNLVLRDFGGWPTQITGFDIVDISSRQLEGICWEVKDFENGTVRFQCATAEVEDVEMT